MGVITPIGVGVDALRAGLRAGRSAVAPITQFDASPFVTHIAAEVRDFDPTPFLEGKKIKRLDKFSPVCRCRRQDGGLGCRPKS